MLGRLNSILGEFTSEKEDWKSYVERLKQYFTANDITTKEKQRAVLISSCGVTTYRLIKNLLSPRAPSEVEFDDIIATVSAQCQPPPSEIMQRYCFNTCIRRPHESVSTYLAHLKQLAEYCNLRDTLPQMLRDRLVCGIADERWQKRLLSEDSLTYDNAVKILRALEAAEYEVKDLSTQKPVHRVATRSKPVHSYPKRVSSSPVEKPTPTCYRCGGPHKAPVCPLKDVECNYCHKKGHIEKVCRSKLNNQGKKKTYKKATHMVTESEEHESVSHEYSMFNFQPAGSLPFIVEVTVNHSQLSMEVDTGAALSIISKATYERLWMPSEAPPLQETQARLKSYNGVDIAVEGEIYVNVKYQMQEALLPVKGSGPSLLGRNWLEHLILDWSSLHLLNIADNPGLPTLLDKHSNLFKEELGKLVGTTAKIYLKKDAKPHYCRARQVPHSLRAKVESEIERLITIGVLQPVQFSDWAAPVVPVLKHDGSVRFCGDYKLTINQEALLDTYPLPRIEDLFASLAGGTVFSTL